MPEFFENNEMEERVILVGVSSQDGDDTEDSLDELEELVKTAGAVTVGRVIQNRQTIHPGLYIGSGKVEELLDEIAWTARHTLAAIPDHVAAHKLLDRIVVLRLHDIDDLTGIVIVKLRRRADTRTHPAIHARMKPLPHPHIFHQHIEILTHTKKITSQQQSYPFPRYRTVVEIPIFAVCNVRTQRGKETPSPKQTTRCQ